MMVNDKDMEKADISDYDIIIIFKRCEQDWPRRKLTSFQENIGQVKQPAEKYGPERESIKTDAKYCWEKQLRNTVEKYSSEILLRNT